MKDYQYLLLIILTLVAILVVGFFNLQINESQKYKKLAENNFLRKKIIKPTRGEMFDRNFSPIAENKPSLNLYIVPGKIKDKEKLVNFIYSEFGFDKEKLKKIIYDNRFRINSEILIKGHIPYELVAKTSEVLNYYPSLMFKTSTQRHYLLKNHFTGYVDNINKKEYTKLKTKGYNYNDFIGKSGLEKKYEPYLKGKKGFRIEKYNALGKKIDFFDDELYKETTNGFDLILSIDSNYQTYLYSLFKKQEKGCIVVMDTKNGEILAYVSYPSYDPNNFIGTIPQTVWDSLRNNPAKPMLDRISKATYPPASLFKPIIGSLGLEKNIITEHTKLENCTGTMQIGNRAVKCWNKYGHGRLNIIQAIAYSCDVYFYDLSLRFNLSDINNYVKESLITEKTGIDLDRERKGFFPSEKWYKKNYGRHISLTGLKVNLSIGQGEILLSPLQICNYYTALANDGVYKTPHLLQKMIGEETIYYSDLNNQPIKKLPISKKNIKIIQKALKKVTYLQYGTGKAAQVSGAVVYGKTGSAENHMGSVTHAWYACYAKWNNQAEIAIAVFKENAGHGGSQAAPLAQKAISYYQKYLRE